MDNEEWRLMLTSKKMASLILNKNMLHGISSYNTWVRARFNRFKSCTETIIYKIFIQ